MRVLTQSNRNQRKTALIASKAYKCDGEDEGERETEKHVRGRAFLPPWRGLENYPHSANVLLFLIGAARRG
jgi:hypothetical protein